jgi:glycosyltransferase involved in cell wall biosynthesis
VLLHGRVAIEELPARLAASDIGLVPSLREPYLEYSLSTKLLEYAAMGVPTVATDLATFRHHFTDTAVRFISGAPDALADAIASLAADPAAAVAMGLEARRQAAAYDWTRQRATYLGIVDRLAR